MGDTRVIIDHLRLHYQGPMNTIQLFAAADRFFREQGYDKGEPHTYEYHTKEGIGIDWNISHWKKVSNEMRFIVKARAKFEHLTPLKLKKKDFMQGKVTFWIDGILESDYENRWEERPMLQFVRWVFDRFFYLAYTERFEQRLTNDVHRFYDHLEQFLNLNRTKYKPTNLPRF